MTIEDTIRRVVREEIERAMGDARPVDYDIPALAELFDVTPRTARRLAGAMEPFGAYKDRGEWWVPVEAIRAYQETKRREHHGVDDEDVDTGSWRDIRRGNQRDRRRVSNGR